jgi:triacylglycerol lipase
MTKPYVLLLHGLGESAMKMALIELFLRSSGYRTVNISYPSRLFSTEELAKTFVTPVLEQLEKEEILHVVTHSLGGILLRASLQNREQKNLGRVIMLAPANQGSEIIEIYRRNPLFAAISGPVSQESGTGENCYPCKIEDEINYELGIIAGSLAIDPLSFLFIKWPQDGRVSAQSTELDGMKDHIVIPSSHELITYNPITLYQIYFFLTHGYFYKQGQYMSNDNNKNAENKENAKNSAWKTPMDLPSVKPEDYDIAIESANGSSKNGSAEKADLKKPHSVPKKAKSNIR